LDCKQRTPNVCCNGSRDFLHLRTARPVQKMHRVKIREREKYDSASAALQWNILFGKEKKRLGKKKKPGEAGL